MKKWKRMFMTITLCVSMVTAIPAGALCYAQENTDTNMSESFVLEETGDTKIQSVVHEDTDLISWKISASNMAIYMDMEHMWRALLERLAIMKPVLQVLHGT